MANSKYAYVKSYEVDDEITLPNIIVVRLDGRNFSRFSKFHEFEKPNDMKGLELMNECAEAVLNQFPDILLSYGFSDEYSFVFKKEATFYQRRASKIRSVIVSFFTSVYVTKWKAFFPEKDLRYAPSFRSRIICCASTEDLQAYLGRRQSECHGSREEDINELLYKVNINYKKDIPEIFCHGTCVLKTKVKVNKKKDGSLVDRIRRSIIRVYPENIASRRFWNEQVCLVKEFGEFTEDLNKTKSECVNPFLYEKGLTPSNWIVVRIDGCHFHRFSDDHQFEKPNDAQALNLMNSCAAGVLEEFKDIVFAYGVSDEYSFVLKKGSSLCESGIVSEIVSFFSSMYTMKWKEFFPHKEMKKNPPPYFDGRAVCYPTSEILRDYLAWRQVDCHINNQYNTCFWMLVKSGKSKSDAQNCLKGTRAREKNDLLDELSGVVNYYNTLPPMFRQGSSIYWEKEVKNAVKSHKIVVVKNCDIIGTSFWDAHPEILNEEIALKHKCNTIPLLSTFLIAAVLIRFYWLSVIYTIVPLL